MPNSTPHIIVLLASTRDGRAGATVATWFMDIAKTRTDLTMELVDLKDYPLPFYSLAAMPKQAETTYDGVAKTWFDKIASADGFVFVTPEYNHGYPGALKNALDYLYTPWNRKPLSFVSYGGISGGLRSTEHLRAVTKELQLVDLREEIIFPFVRKAFDEHGQPVNPALVKSAATLLDAMAWWAETLKTARDTKPYPQP